MTNTKVSNNNPEKESIINKSITKAKDNEIIKNKAIQNKKVTSVSKKPNKSLDDISNEIFSELISKKISLVKEIKDLETKKAGHLPTFLKTLVAPVDPDPISLRSIFFRNLPNKNPVGSDPKK